MLPVQFIRKSTHNIGQESLSGVVILEEDDPATVARMLRHFYGWTYDDKQPSPLQTQSSESPDYESISMTPAEVIMLNNVLMYALAEKFDLSSLMDISTSRFDAVHDRLAPTQKDRVTLAGFRRIVVTIHETTPPSALCLRRSAARFCAKHIREILADQDWWDFMTDHREFAITMLDEHSYLD